MIQIVQDLKDKNILVVEDGQDIRDIIATTFGRIFKNTYTANDGKEGLEKFKELKPDIIVTDIRMPNMSGNDMIDEIKQIDPNIPVIVVSGHGRMIKKENKADIFLEKPIKFDKLIREIHNLVC